MSSKLDQLFKDLEKQFDIEEPKIGHFNRFEAKLNKTSNKKRNSKLYAFAAIAASIILFFGIWVGKSYSNKGIELSNVSSEMQETQTYFTTAIEKELETIEKERDKNTEHIINDALQQIQRLEQEYQSLTLELKESAEDKRIIYAMISNFQQRIDVLQNVLIQIETVKQLKKQNNEKYV